MADQFADLLAQAELKLDRTKGTLREQLYLQLRRAVLAGRLPSGTPMPSTRELAGALGIARSTVVDAFDQLKAEGFLETRQGAPTRVVRLDRSMLGAGRRSAAAAGPAVRAQERRTHWQDDNPPLPITQRAFRPSLPDLDAFPAREWAAHLGRRARRPVLHDLSYTGYTGVPSLRQQILNHVRLARHVQAESEQVIVLPSAQSAFDLVAQMTLQPGDAAWVEDPGYLGMVSVLRGHRARLVPVPVDGQGLQSDFAGPRPSLVYLTPSHQAPTGVLMSLQRRLELLAVAHRAGAAIIEDDYDSEFQYVGQPTASLQGLDRHGCVHYVGTFSKSLSPGLHVAYLIVPPQFVQLAHTVALARGLTVPVHMQLALADFMEAGGLRRHIRAMTAEYGARMALLTEALRSAAGDLLTVPVAAGGLQRCVGLPGTVSDTSLVAALRAAGIAALPVSAQCHAARLSGLVLGVGLVKQHEVVSAAKLLCEVVRHELRGR